MHEPKEKKWSPYYTFSLQVKMKRVKIRRYQVLLIDYVVYSYLILWSNKDLFHVNFDMYALANNDPFETK